MLTSKDVVHSSLNQMSQVRVLSMEKSLTESATPNEALSNVNSNQSDFNANIEYQMRKKMKKDNQKGAHETISTTISDLREVRYVYIQSFCRFLGSLLYLLITPSLFTLLNTRQNVTRPYFKLHQKSIINGAFHFPCGYFSHAFLLCFSWLIFATLFVSIYATFFFILIRLKKKMSFLLGVLTCFALIRVGMGRKMMNSFSHGDTHTVSHQVRFFSCNLNLRVQSLKYLNKLV